MITSWILVKISSTWSAVFVTVATSPLRYPGGKSCLLETVADVLRINKLERRPYAEPYAGGCGLALELLYGGFVSDLYINDIDKGIWSFWDCVLHNTDEFLEKMSSTPVTIDEWHRQRDIHRNSGGASTLDHGFATFFLNRTNRSGIIKAAGVIGGLDQTGNYKLDCRFNKDELSKRVRRIARYRNRITLTRLDAVAFLDPNEGHFPSDTFLCIDPPYFNKGSALYTSFYNPDDHAKLRDVVLKLQNPWIITYDSAPEIKALYSARRQFEFGLNYSVQTKRLGTEVMIASKGLKIPNSIKAGHLSVKAAA
jgi:DNA adenine methylase